MAGTNTVAVMFCSESACTTAEGSKSAMITRVPLRHAIEVFGCEFGQGYGMTEATAVATVLTPREHLRALDERPELLLSAGRPLPGTEVRVVDADNREVPVGEIGETLTGGWMHTGDAGCVDAEGFLFVQDRVKDMIISGAENIYPREVENALFEHPAIADAAVIGVPDDHWGETVKAVVVLRDGRDADAAELIEFCRTRLGGYKCPRSVDFVSALPRNPSGKILKKGLREPYWAGRTRGVG